MARANATETKKRTPFFSGPAEIAGPRLALVLAVFFLSVVGLVAVFSASSIEAIGNGLNPASDFVRQAAYMLFGIIICVVIVKLIPYEAWLSRLLDIYWLVTLVLLLLTAAIGTIGLGAQRWLSIGPFSFQPSEFAKVAFVLMMARIMYNARTSKIDFKIFTAQIVGLVILPLGVIFIFQSDLGTTAICLLGIVAVVFLSGVPFATIFKLFVAIAAFAVVGILAKAYRGTRLNFLNPEADYFGAGYQLSRSMYAFGEGGLFGVGLGNSSERYLYLPEAETDFIFAIIGEELGLIGALAVVAAFFVILWAGLKIAKSAPDLFGSMVAGGCTVMLVAHAFINIACVTGMLPTTGKPLPFVSSGGSSLWGSFMLVGIILSVSLAANSVGGIYDRRRENLRVVHGNSSEGRKKAKGISSSQSRKKRRGA